MNRKLLIIGAIFLVGLRMGAQNSISNDWNAMFEKVKESKFLVNNVLWDYGMADSVVLKHTGSRSDELSDFSIWSELYQNWGNSCFGAGKKVQVYDSIRHLFSDYHRKGISVVPMMWVEGNRIKSGAFADGALKFDTVSRQIEMVHPEKVFEKANVFASVPFVQTTMSNMIQLLFSKQFYYSNSKHQLKSIQMKIDQGLFENIPFDKIVKLQLKPGLHLVELQVELENNEKLFSSFELYFKEIDPGKDNGGINKYLNIGDEFGNIYTKPYRNTETGEALGAFIYVFPGSTDGQLNTCIKKPIIFVEGIDFGYKDHMTGCYGGKCGNVGFRDLLYGKLYNPYETKYKNMYEDWEPIKNAPKLIDKLKNDGYDLIYLDFHNGADYMENNAMLLVELIKRVNFMKCSNEELVVIGASMGGQVTRFALSYMEQNNMNHCVRNFVSFDSPNRGANIPLGFQHFIKYYEGKLPSVKDVYERKIKRPATQQLLIHSCMSYNGVEQNALKSEFDSRMGNLLGFPQFPRSVAVLNGCIQPVSQGFGPGEKLLEMNPYVGTLNFDFLEINATVWSSFAKFDNMNLVMQGKMIGNNRYWAKVPGNMKQLDHIQGSKRFDLKEARVIYGLFNIINRGDATCFIPSYSALNFKEELTDYNYDMNLVNDKPNRSLHSFDAFYGPKNENQEHILITDENMDWIVNQINANRNDLPSFLSTQYNFGRIEKNTISQVEIQSNAILRVNGLGLTGFGKSKFDKAVEPGSHYDLYSTMCQPIITVNKEAQLVLGEIAGNQINTANFYLRKGAVLKLKEGSILKINNKSQLIVEEGAKLIYSKGAKIVLDGPESMLQIDGELELEDQSVFQVVHSPNSPMGYIKMRNVGGGYGKARISVKSGKAYLDLKGIAKSKTLLQVEGVIDCTGYGKIDSTSIVNCKIEYGDQSGLVFTNRINLDEVDFKVLPWAIQKNSTALALQNCNNIYIKSTVFKGFEYAIKQTGSKSELFKISLSEFKNNKNGLLVDAKYFYIEHSSFYDNVTTGMQLNSNFKDAMLKSNIFYNNTKAAVFNENKSPINRKAMLYDCHFYNNQQSIVSYNNDLILSCCLFDNNKQSIYSEHAVIIMSKNFGYKGVWGNFQSGNCTFKHKDNRCIELVETSINISNGNNNFIYNGINSNYNFIVGSIQLDVNALYPNSLDLNVNQNYWFPQPNVNWSKEHGKFYNIQFNHPILGLKQSLFRGNNLSTLNTFCYNNNNQFLDTDLENDCLSDSVDFYSLNHTLKYGLNIYPLPASEYLHVSGLRDLKVKTVEIINTNGQILGVFEVESNDFQIDVRSYKEGMYYLVYDGENGTGHLMFTVMHR